MKSKTQRKHSLIGFEEPKPRWYHYALRRLPSSLLISFVMICFVIPILFLAAGMIYRWFMG